ncbi:hypothetical protein M406DRAFT_333536 [Cryphonectria parasitica EP155]|uniref:Zn(2)-C6 fungal-type domain-containing protein n=1 Tax=Cryphonectria parasitica (strain ATCC 38755 / EP155) TaxID=660469 RepID=A0A9P4XV40_CRYP1|nr:uncharacterized protein M406DRAFT_333536 [Cryphonectria parasitica EP155]KAF3761476.1 hypothetical protein M406DRAFT_333536 [Cryphonectria parasitica EP155]
MDKDQVATKLEAVMEDISGADAQPQEPQPQYHSLPTVAETHDAFFPGDRDVEAAQQEPDPPTPPQRARPDVAAEDLQLGSHGDDQIQQLQLAAQMSQALQGVVGNSAVTEDNSYQSQRAVDLEESLHQLRAEQSDSEMHSREHSLSESHILPPDVSAENMQSTVQQELQQTLQQAIQHAESRQDSESHHTAQSPFPPHAHAQAQYLETPQPPTLAPAIPASGTQSQYTLADVTPPRKRSKVSRACDECRRKKVKCDSMTENGDEACSNCRRSNVRCMFSRVPQKRGPSKGYIKELADRINSIEGKLGGQTAAEALAGELVARGSIGETYSAFAQLEDSRKRPLSQISGGNIPTPTPNRPVIPQQTSYSASGLALKPILPRTSIGTPQSRSLDVDGTTLHRQVPQPAPVAPGIEENVYTSYFYIVHHVLPFLPGSREAMASRLTLCSTTLQNAFIEALNSTMGSFEAVQNVHGRLVTANRLLAEFDAEGGKHAQVSDLVYLQCLILMIINVDNLGISSLSREHEGPAKVSLLGRAAGLAYAMGIPQEAMTLCTTAGDEPDECIRARAWWTLVVLDRWNAISTATPLVISSDTVVLPHNLRPILGEVNYRFSLLAYIIGHWSPASITAPLHSTPGSGTVASATFHLNMEMWRAHFPGDISPHLEPVLHLSYWHCRLLAFLFMPSALITDVTWAVRESVRLLTSHAQMISPLNHHFTSLTTLCLIEMTKNERSREEATQLLRNLLDANISPSTWDDSIRARIRATLSPSTSSAAATESTASQNLQQLADLATAADIPGATTNNNDNNNTAAISDLAPDTPAERPEDEPKFRTSDDYEDLGFDPRPLLRAGYLNVIAQPSH